VSEGPRNGTSTLENEENIVLYNGVSLPNDTASYDLKNRVLSYMATKK
jgi:hypothetical protein